MENNQELKIWLNTHLSVYSQRTPSKYGQHDQDWEMAGLRPKDTFW